MAERDWRGPRVLVVDDDEGTRQALHELLELEGIEVVGDAPDGARALALMHELAPDVVLMDLRMPDLGGIEATRLIRERFPGTEVVIFTGYEGPLPERSAEQVGAFAYLVKGCSAAFMRQVIEQASRRATEYRETVAEY